MAAEISHEGIVRALEGGLVRVEIVQQAACAGCKAKSMCTASESMVKEIVAMPLEPMEIGDSVDVCVEKRLGWKAVLYAFILPTALLFVCMAWVFPRLVEQEWLSGVLSLVALLPYYGVLHLLSPRFEAQYQFTAKKLINL